MTRPDSLFNLQTKFAAHLRDPERTPAPTDVEDRRMKVYRELVYNNIESFISGAFPVLRSLTNDEKWHCLVRGFISGYYCQSPYFLEISQEFLTYLQEQRAPAADDLPFMFELAHYEWIELAVDVDVTEFPSTGFNPGGNLMHARPFVSPLAHVLHYQFPVHRIGPQYVPLEPVPPGTFLIVYRDQQCEVRFMEVNGVTARLLMVLEEQKTFTGEQAVRQIIEEMQHPDEQLVLDGGREALGQLYQSGIVLGTELMTVTG